MSSAKDVIGIVCENMAQTVERKNPGEKNTGVDEYTFVLFYKIS